MVRYRSISCEIVRATQPVFRVERACTRLPPSQSCAFLRVCAKIYLSTIILTRLYFQLQLDYFLLSFFSFLLFIQLFLIDALDAIQNSATRATCAKVHENRL